MASEASFMGLGLKHRDGSGKADDPPAQIVAHDEVNLIFRSPSLRLKNGARQ
jgi:hypothetical protein